MSILSGIKRYKDYLKTEKGYQLMSRWTKSDAVIMGDGTDDTDTLENRLGAIKGITDSITEKSKNLVVSAYGLTENLQKRVFAKMHNCGNLYIEGKGQRFQFNPDTSAKQICNVVIYINVTPKSEFPDLATEVWLPINVPPISVCEDVQLVRGGYSYFAGSAVVDFKITDKQFIELEHVYINGSENDIADKCAWYATYVQFEGLN